MCGKTVNGILAVFLMFFAVSMAVAATEEEKQKAIEKGLAYLYETQDIVSGSWPRGDYGDIYSSTGSSVLAFLQAKAYWGENAEDYQVVVDKGLDFILSNARIVPISIQLAGDPDGDPIGVGAGVGVRLYPSTSESNYDIYATSICLPAIAASGTPEKVVIDGPLAGWTYRDVVQNVIDYLAWAQNDPGGMSGSEGGWWNFANYVYRSDQADTQWAVIAGMYASLMGVSYPKFVLDELAIWTEYIQNESGAAGYTSPFSLYQNPEGQTGALLTMLFFLGRNPGISSVDLALSYINNYWNSDESSILYGNFGRPYTMRAIYNGLAFMIGLDDEQTITNLRPDPGDTDNPYNWWEDYCEFLVGSQYPDGHWDGDINWNQSVATPWYIYILVPGFGSEDPGSEPSAIEVSVDVKPAACPNQLNVASKGMLPVAIAGSKDLDVTTINPLTIQLAGVAPNHYSYDDVTSPYSPMTGKEGAYACAEEGPDGYPDMVLTFDTQAIVAAMGEVEDGGLSVLSLTGNLLEESGGTAITGEDVVSILKKAGGNNNGNSAHGIKSAPGNPNS